jgi:tripartite-type tricarboxylate transporter receptor subunit TctC
MPRLSQASRRDREERLLAAARHCFGALGYDATSIAGIARMAGVSDGLMYRYFDDKRALLVAVLAQFFEELIDRARSAVAVESSFAGMTNVLPHLATGKLKALAVTTATRAPQLPNVPTMQEAGVAGYDASNWLALLGPAGMPKEIVQRLNSEIAKIMAQPDTQKTLFEAGVQVGLSTPEELSQLMQAEMVKWSKIVKSAGITME